MIKEILQGEVRQALRNLSLTVDVSNIEVTKSEHFGDYATNAALVIAKPLGKKPMELAEELKEEILKSPTGKRYIKEASIAKPGFINFFVSEGTILNEMETLGEHIGKGFDFLKHKKINIEFISANPTGDLHIGHGRGAFYGDILSSILSYSGAEVTREFYINDSKESNQIKELGKTALGKGEQYKTPELEDKIGELDFSGLSEEDAGVKLASAVQASNRKFIEESLGVHFDVWYSEDTELHASGANRDMLARLKERDFTYEKDGALWLKTSEYGDDEDRVIVRSDSTMTYFIADIAYHQNKFDRGFQTVIDVWGADHHGHIKRMQAVGRMLGWPKTPNTDTEQPLVFIAQLVSLKEDGVSKKMSKRAGNVILLRDLVEEFGIDIVRWFFIEKALNTQMAFDMALAREKSEKNPVYYVQYAHARIASIEEKTRLLTPHTRTTFLELMNIPSAHTLASRIIEFQEVITDIALTYNVNTLTVYATELASATNAFYRDVRIIENEQYDEGALLLARSAKKTL